MAIDTPIVIFDTTLRDGEQSPGCTMHPAEKLRFAHQLARLGVDIIEAGFAIASHGDFNSVQAIAREVSTSGQAPRIASLARCRREDIEAAARALESAHKNRIHVFLASSDLHLEAKLKITRAQALDNVADAVRLARTFADDVEFSTEDGTRSELDFLIQMITVAVQAGATTINIPDTVGYTTPSEYKQLFETVRTRVPDSDRVIFSTHCHNDLGLAVANSLAGIEGGARQVECTINGIGERAGNAALEEIAAAFVTRHDRYPYTNHIVMSELYPTSRMLGEIISFGCQPNKAIVGKNAFAHEAGIHQDGYLKERSTYEIIDPRSVGVPEGRLVLGKHSGRHALNQRAKDLGYNLSKQELDGLYHRFIAVADHRKKGLMDKEIVALIRDGEVAGRAAAD
jgi:2-isopropylmalate synthase